MLTVKDVEEVDRSRLYMDYEGWPEHWERALEVEVEAPRGREVRDIIYAGMGGSAVAGDILHSLLAPISEVPFTVVKDYHLPGYASKDTFVLAVSCSGETEETVNIVGEAVKRGCSVAAVSSGGLLQEVSRRRGVPHTKVPRLKVPRSSLPYLFCPSVSILRELDLWRRDGRLEGSISQLREFSRKIGVASPVEENPSKGLAVKIYDGIPVIYSSAENRAASIRFKASLNENAKMAAYTSELPELCHNEVEAWSMSKSSTLRPVFFRWSEETPEVYERFEAVKQIVESSGCRVTEVWEVGGDQLSRALTSIYLLDYASIYTAVLRKVDPIVTPSIDILKKRLRERLDYIRRYTGLLEA